MTVLAFLPKLEASTEMQSPRWVEASDWFVIFTLSTLIFLMGAFAAWAWIIWLRTTRPAPHIQLLMELQNEAEQVPTAPTTPQETDFQAPWQQSADWWKKAED